MTLKILIPDCHHHHQDQRAIDSVWSAIDDVKPDEVCILGDYLDCKAPARWSKGTADEFAEDLLDEAEAGKKNLAALRGALGWDRKISYILGNHEDRIANYVRQHAPAIGSIVPGIDELLDFDSLGVELERQPYAIASGVRAIHGDKLSSTLSSAGQSAYKERLRHGTSIVQGHTHRAGLGFDTQDRTRFWMECGHLLDIKQAHYLKYGIGNWQQAFGYLHIDGGRITPGLVYVHPRGRFYFNGRSYGS
jgi:predicted phosphodiesterase